MNTTRAYKTSGFSLIEFMVALIIGLVLVAAISSVYMGSRRSSKTQGSLAQVQEEGRFANLLVVPGIRQAGYLASPLTQTDPSQVFRSANNKLAVMGYDNVTGSTPTTAIFPGFDPTKVVSGTDVLAIAFEGKSVDISGTVTSIDTPLRTCLGRDVASTQIAVNVFFIRNDETGVPSLYCYDNLTLEQSNTSTAAASTPQALVAGVTDFQITYGLANGSGTGAVRYVAAGSVTDWTRIASVQLTFTVMSLEATERGTGTDIATGANAGKLTHTFTATVQIRNRLSV